jgi:predicted metal-dependent phosphoesterase TrpH
MLIDLHCHTKYSGDNRLEPIDLIRAARARGLDAVCITEHDSFCASEPVEALAERVGFPVFRGAEINTDKGHILAFGLRDDSWKNENSRYYSHVEEIRPVVDACGGILVPAHPFRMISSASAAMNLFEMNYIAAVEVLNGENTERENEMAKDAWARLAIPGTGGSDCHFASTVGTFATWFEKDISSITELIEEIRAGRVAPACVDAAGNYRRIATDVRNDKRAL